MTPPVQESGAPLCFVATTRGVLARDRQRVEVTLTREDVDTVHVYYTTSGEERDTVGETCDAMVDDVLHVFEVHELVLGVTPSELRAWLRAGHDDEPDAEPTTLGLGSAPSASYEVAFEFAARNMPGRMGDPVAPLAHEFAEWAEDAWTSGHVDAAFERWMVDMKAPVRPGLAGDEVQA